MGFIARARSWSVIVFSWGFGVGVRGLVLVGPLLVKSSFIMESGMETWQRYCCYYSSFELKSQVFLLRYAKV